MLEGMLQNLAVEVGTPARYRLVVGPDSEDGSHSLDLNSIINKGLCLEFKSRITCLACAADTPRSYGDGHCYPCFKRLARCDLCVVDPVRCHYAQGTCREPEWGEAFCMRPHLVYLANSSAPKVGITTEGGQVRRWLDQGASQGLVVARARTRHLAGVLEAGLARQVSDRTDWRALLRADARPVDLVALRRVVRSRAGEPPAGVDWLEQEQPMTLEYPVQAYPRRLVRFDLAREGTVAGRLTGVKGQYLMFEHGVLNVRRFRAHHVGVTVFDADDSAAAPLGGWPRQSQMELFS